MAAHVWASHPRNGREEVGWAGTPDIAATVETENGGAGGHGRNGRQSHEGATVAMAAMGDHAENAEEVEKDEEDDHAANGHIEEKGGTWGSA